MAKRVAKNVTLERILVGNKNGDVVSQFHIHPRDDGELRSSDVIFISGYFNVSSVLQDRIVLGIWSNNRFTSHICLVFDNQARAKTFYDGISMYCNKDIIIDQDKADVLFSADLRRVLDIY